MELKILSEEDVLEAKRYPSGFGIHFQLTQSLKELHDILQTQAKLTAGQIVEWVEQHSRYAYEGAYTELALRVEDWQSLKELVK